MSLLGADVNALMPDMDPRTILFIHHPQDASAHQQAQFHAK